MNKKFFALTLCLITAGACVSVLAHNDLMPSDSLRWLTGSNVQAAKLNAMPPASHSMAGDNPTSGTFADTLNNAQVSEHQDGDLIVVISAVGDLPGTLTLKVHRTGTTITGGEWAFNVAYTEETQIPNPPPGEPDHTEALIQRGSLKGTITGGQVSLNGDGTVSAIDSVQLSINGATMEFEATNSGTADGHIVSLQDAANSTGEITLSF
jgi:hypothetical protein